MPAFAGRVLPGDEIVVLYLTNAGPDRDAFFAATAPVHGQTDHSDGQCFRFRAGRRYRSIRGCHLKVMRQTACGRIG